MTAFAEKPTKKTRKISRKGIDPARLFAYNRIMTKSKRQNKIRLTAKILLPVLCGLWLAFIFSNSLQTGTESSAQSSSVVDAVVAVAKWVAPQSSVANATGEGYDKLHSLVRTLAHFTEFAVLGALAGWCYFAYTGRLTHCYIPVLGTLLVPFIDELLQKFTSERAASFSDILVDSLGGIAGLAFAGLTVWLGWRIYQAKKNKE